MKLPGSVPHYLVMAPHSKHPDVRVPIPYWNKADALSRMKWLRTVGNSPVLKTTILCPGVPRVKLDELGFTIKRSKVVTFKPIDGLAKLRCPPESYLHFYPQ